MTNIYHCIAVVLVPVFRNGSLFLQFLDMVGKGLRAKFKNQLLVQLSLLLNLLIIYLDGIRANIGVHSQAANIYYKFLHKNEGQAMDDLMDFQFYRRSNNISVGFLLVHIHVYIWD